MSFLRIRFYPAGGSGPVKDFLDWLASRHPAAHLRLALDLEILGAEGLRSGQITVRGLGEGLWELKRHFGGVQCRILFCIDNGCAWLLHGFIKKSPRTPLSDMRLARKRMRGMK